MVTTNAPVSRHGLGADGLLESDLWLDRPDAPEEIARRRAAGRISEEEAAHLEHFWRHGYFTFELDLDAGLCDAIDADVERLWREQPPWMAFAYHSLLTRFSGDDREKRKPSSRIADLHEYSTPALELYLHPRLHRYVELVLERPALATQSLYFQWGSQQALHRDPIHVRMNPPSHLVASWVALEDIRPGSGELQYVAGSHRLPYFEFEPGRYFFDHKKDAPERAREAERWDLERCREKSLAPQPFHPKRGECLIWHHSLLHGGAELVDPTLTRKSFVVHYTSRPNMPATMNTYLDPYAAPEPGEKSPPARVYHSRRRHRMGDREGFVSPLVERFSEEARERYRRPAEGDQRIAALGAELAACRAEIEAMKASRFWKLHDAWWAMKRRLGGG
jgi:hypothetical protein